MKSKHFVYALKLWLLFIKKIIKNCKLNKNKTTIRKHGINNTDLRWQETWFCSTTSTHRNDLGPPCQGGLSIFRSGFTRSRGLSGNSVPTNYWGTLTPTGCQLTTGLHLAWKRLSWMKSASVLFLMDHELGSTQRSTETQKLYVD